METKQINLTNILKEVVKGLNIVETERLKQEGYINEHFFKGVLTPENLTEEYKYKILEKKKYFYINSGNSGVFMIEKESGEIFNINGYGTPDKNKKLKANLGNIRDYVFTKNNFLDINKIKILHAKRYNYLR